VTGFRPEGAPFMGLNIKSTSYPGSDAQGAGSFNSGHWYLFVIQPACATYLRPPKRGLRVGGSRFGEGRCLEFGAYPRYALTRQLTTL